MQMLQQHTASREKRPNVITFSGELKANLKLLTNSVPPAHLIPKFEGILFPMFGRDFIGFGLRAEYLQYGRLTLAPTMVKFGTRHTEDSNNFLKRFVTRTHQIVPFFHGLFASMQLRLDLRLNKDSFYLSTSVVVVDNLSM